MPAIVTPSRLDPQLSRLIIALAKAAARRDHGLETAAARKVDDAASSDLRQVLDGPSK